MRLKALLFVLALTTYGTAALAIDPADRCEGAKLKISAKFYSCNLKAAAKSLRTGNPTDVSACELSFAQKWSVAEAKAGGLCPTNGDQAVIQSKLAADAGSLPQRLTGTRFVDHGNGTMTDTQTGLMWEMKTTGVGEHNVDTYYTWSASGELLDGTAFTYFLAQLNNNFSGDGDTVNGCLAGHCDWRLPTITELKTIMLLDSGLPPAGYGPIGTDQYWSSTTYSGDASQAWNVTLLGGDDLGHGHKGSRLVRAVRGGSAATEQATP